MKTEPAPNEPHPPYPSSEPAGSADPAAASPLSWIPASGHQLSRTGVQFDAVRIAGLRAEEVADALIEETANRAGAIVHEAVGHQWMYFLLPPGTATEYRWPPGIMRFGRTTSAGYVGVPALKGDAWPLSWYSPPSTRTPFVDPGLLHETLCRLIGWRPLEFNR